MSFVDGLKTLGQTVAKYAPLLGEIIPIPGARAVTQIIANEFGGSAENPDDLVKRITADPQAQIKLAEIESNHKVTLQNMKMMESKYAMEHILGMQQTEDQDRKSARDTNRQDQTMGQRWVDECIKVILVLTMNLILMLCIYAMIKSDLNQAEASIVSLIIGYVMGNGIGAMVQFYWGTSSSSQRKDGVISQVLSKFSNKKSSSDEIEKLVV